MNKNTTAKGTRQRVCFSLVLTCTMVSTITPAHRMAKTSLIRAAILAAFIPNAGSNQDKSSSTHSTTPAWILGIDASWHGKDYQLIPNASPDDHYVMTKCHKQRNQTSIGTCLNRVIKSPYYHDTWQGKIAQCFFGYKKISDIPSSALVPDESASQDGSARAAGIKHILQQRYWPHTLVRIEYDKPQKDTQQTNNMVQLTLKLLSDLQGNILCTKGDGRRPAYFAVFDIEWGYGYADIRIKQAERSSRIIADGTLSPHEVIRTMKDIAYACMSDSRGVTLAKYFKHAHFWYSPEYSIFLHAMVLCVEELLS